MKREGEKLWMKRKKRREREGKEKEKEGMDRKRERQPLEEARLCSDSGLSLDRSRGAMKTVETRGDWNDWKRPGIPTPPTRRHATPRDATRRNGGAAASSPFVTRHRHRHRRPHLTYSTLVHFHSPRSAPGAASCLTIASRRRFSWCCHAVGGWCRYDSIARRSIRHSCDQRTPYATHVTRRHMRAESRDTCVYFSVWWV